MLLRKSIRACCRLAESAWKAWDAVLPCPSWRMIAVAISAARPSWRKVDLARKPHSGAVRIMVGPALPEVIPSPSDPMSCRRKSEYGWNTCEERAWLREELIGIPPVVGGMKDAGLGAVVSVAVWHPPHPS